jgi:hypothetical protein
VEGREREGKRGFARAAAGGGKKKKGNVRIRKRREEEQMDFPQGPKCNFRKLQGLVCKAKFPINLKP